MAGDWLPVEVDTPRKSEVLSIARQIEQDRRWVVGALVEFWGWVQANSVDGYVDADVDALVDVLSLPRRFFEALMNKNWLEERDKGLYVPNADKWITNGAKSRLQKNKRQQEWRDHKKNVDGDVDVSVSTQASTTEEKRREENKTPLPPKGDDLPDRLWEASPKQARTRSSRKQVADEWRKTKNKPDAEAVLDAMGKWCRCPDWTKENGKYVPGLHRWVKNRRWEDPPDVPGIRELGLSALSDEQRGQLWAYVQSREPQAKHMGPGWNDSIALMNKHLNEWKQDCEQKKSA